MGVDIQQAVQVPAHDGEQRPVLPPIGGRLDGKAQVDPDAVADPVAVVVHVPRARFIPTWNGPVDGRRRCSEINGRRIVVRIAAVKIWLDWPKDELPFEIARDILGPQRGSHGGRCLIVPPVPDQSGTVERRHSIGCIVATSQGTPLHDGQRHVLEVGGVITFVAATLEKQADDAVVPCSVVGKHGNWQIVLRAASVHIRHGSIEPWAAGYQRIVPEPLSAERPAVYHEGGAGEIRRRDRSAVVHGQSHDAKNGPVVERVAVVLAVEPKVAMDDSRAQSLRSAGGDRQHASVVVARFLTEYQTHIQGHPVGTRHLNSVGWVVDRLFSERQLHDLSTRTNHGRGVVSRSGVQHVHVRQIGDHKRPAESVFPVHVTQQLVKPNRGTRNGITSQEWIQRLVQVLLRIDSQQLLLGGFDGRASVLAGNDDVGRDQ